MANKAIEVHGLEELQARMAQYPVKYTEIMAQAVATSLLVLQENVPPYPPAPETSNYKRTGTLGRSLGIAETGGKIGMPSIYQIRKVGGMDFEGKFGTNLHYAPRVIGSRGQQSSFFATYWWRLDEVVNKSYHKILEVFNKAAAALAKFLAG